MKINVYPVYGDVDPEELKGAAAVVIDTLRMTSTATTALENGCEGIYVVSETDEGLQLARSIDALIGGERKALKVSGFDFGNSPLEYTREAVCGRRLVMTTTNGTRAVLSANGADDIYLGCLRNAKAVAEVLRGYEKVAMICAGTRGKFSLEDGLTAGAMAACLPEADTDDMGTAMKALYMRYAGHAAELMSGCAHYRYLESLGFSRDLEWCLTENVSGTVPKLNGGRFTV